MDSVSIDFLSKGSVSEKHNTKKKIDTNKVNGYDVHDMRATDGLFCLRNRDYWILVSGVSGIFK